MWAIISDVFYRKYDAEHNLLVIAKFLVVSLSTILKFLLTSFWIK